MRPEDPLSGRLLTKQNPIPPSPQTKFAVVTPQQQAVPPLRVGAPALHPQPVDRASASPTLPLYVLTRRATTGSCVQPQLLMHDAGVGAIDATVQIQASQSR